MIRDSFCILGVTHRNSEYSSIQCQCSIPLSFTVQMNNGQVIIIPSRRETLYLSFSTSTLANELHDFKAVFRFWMTVWMYYVRLSVTIEVWLEVLIFCVNWANIWHNILMLTFNPSNYSVHFDCIRYAFVVFIVLFVENKM